jgi:hypothetical protein
VSEQPPLKQKIFHTALAISRERNSLLEFGKPVSAWLEFKHRIADKVVFSNIRQKLGGRLQYVLNLLLPTPQKSVLLFLMLHYIVFWFVWFVLFFYLDTWVQVVLRRV